MHCSPWILLSNASVAFLLNIAAVFLVGAGSGLVLTLAGVFKDILLITGSVLIFGSTITPLQVFGTWVYLTSPFTQVTSDSSVHVGLIILLFDRLLDRAGRFDLVQDRWQQVNSFVTARCIGYFLQSTSAYSARSRTHNSIDGRCVT